MPCCPYQITAFNSETTTEPYTPAMQALYGAQPKIDVLYRNEEGNYVAAGVFTLVQFDGSMVYVDHGTSPVKARGILKIGR